jgi:hypothetical protein
VRVLRRAFEGPGRGWRGAAAFATALVVISTLLGAVSNPAVATVSSDQAQIKKLQQQITERGDKVQALVSKYNATQTRVDTLNAQIANDEKHLAADMRKQAASEAAARRVAVRAYVARQSTSPELAMFNSTNDITNVLAGTTYLNSVNANIDQTLASLTIDEERTRNERATLNSERDQANRALNDLASARRDTQSAIASDQALLASVKGDLKKALAQAQEARQKAELAKERALAPPPNVHQPPPPNLILPPAKPGTYANPLRGIAGINPERIDQGVDYSGYGPIFAVGDGVVLSTSVPGWPGGTFIAYQLTDGPATGLVVYAAEDIAPSVSIGSSVNANTVLGQVYEGPSGIETGWADPNAIGNTMARTYGQYHGGNSTAFGANFSQFLQSLGGPGGILQNSPPTGSLPANWPQW